MEHEARVKVQGQIDNKSRVFFPFCLVRFSEEEEKLEPSSVSSLSVFYL